MNLNKVFLIGNLTADPELKTTPSGQSVATVRLATNRAWTDKAGQKQQDTQYHTVILWGRQAEVVNQYLTKGSSIMIEGRIQTRTWQDKNAQTRYTTEIVAENMQLGPRPAGAGGQGQGNGGSSQSWQQNKSAQPSGGKVADSMPSQEPVHEEIPVINMDEEEGINPEDLPF